MPFVISQGSLEQVSRPMMPAVPVGGSIRLADQFSQDYAEIWRTQPQVRTVVSFLARNIAQLGLHVYLRLSDVDRERLSDHPIAELIRKPNPFTTRYRLIESLVSDIAIYDNAFLAKTNTERLSVVRLDPRHLQPFEVTPFTVETYRYQNPGATGYYDFPASQLVHFRGYNAGDARWGCSPMETLRRILAEEYQAGLYREQLWRNGARMAGYLKRPPEAPQWSKEGRERFRRQWRAQYTGTGGANAGGTPILEDGMDFVSAAVSPADAQYIESRKLTREEVAAAFHIPLPMVGILEHATFSNITEQHKNLYQDTLGPWLTMITEELALQLLPDFDATDGVYLEFNLAEKLRGSFEEQANQLQQSVGAPYMTRNEARARLNLPQIEGGDELIVPLNVGTESVSSSPQDTLQQAGRLLEGLRTA